MEKKIGDILQAFQNYRFQDALRQIQQLIKKIGKDNKKKSTLTDKDDRIIHIIKCGSLASMGRLHEANQIFQHYFTDKIVSQISADQAFLLSSIAELCYDRKLLNKIQILNNAAKNEIRLQRFMISHRMFSGVSKSFLKQFATGKRLQDGLAQIFLEYINQVSKNHSIQQDYSRDVKILVNKNLTLKMVELFFMKYLASVSDLSKVANKKLRQSIIDLKIRLSINGNKIEQAKKHYLQNFNFIQENFVYLRSIRDVEQNKQANHRFYIQNCGVIFRRNLDIQSYIPLYDFYDQFLNFLLSEQITKDFTSVKTAIYKSQVITPQKLYNFIEIQNSSVLAHYYHCLLIELNLITKGQKHQAAKKSDYYKISIKGLILQLLKIHFSVEYKINSSPQQLNNSLVKNQSFMSLLEEYFINFSKTLTYTNQMRSYLPYLKQKFQKLFSQIIKQNSQYSLPSTFQKKDDNLILLTNVIKILVVLNKNKLQIWEEVQNWISILWKCYKKFIQQVQQSKRRQKGEVFLSDQFVLVLADVVIYHLQNSSAIDISKDQQVLQTILTKLMALLDQAVETSPFNAYLKLRLMYVCQKLNYFDKLIDTYLSLDIKSVQFQTLGYFILNPINNFNLYSQFENNIIRMVRSYHENQRQTSEYCLKGLKAGTTHQVFEYFSYQKRLEKSYGKMQLFYTLFLQNKNQASSQFYLEWIQNKLNQYKKKQKKIAFNADTKTMQNIIPSISVQDKQISIQQMTFNEYYGIFNSPKIFEMQIKSRMIQKLLNKALVQKQVPCQQKIENYLKQIKQLYVQISKAQVSQDLFSISNQFDLIEFYLDKKQTTQKQPKLTLTKRMLSKQILFYLKLTELKINFYSSFKYLFQILKLTQKDQNLQKSIQDQNINLINSIQSIINYFSNQLRWREQVKKCWNLRQCLFTTYRLSTQFDQQANKIKKLPKSSKNLISKHCKLLLQKILDASTNLKFKENCPPIKNIFNVQIQKNYLQKIIERDQALKRSVTMDIKQAKKFISK